MTFTASILPVDGPVVLQDETGTPHFRTALPQHAEMLQVNDYAQFLESKAIIAAAEVHWN